MILLHSFEDCMYLYLFCELYLDSSICKILRNLPIKFSVSSPYSILDKGIYTDGYRRIRLLKLNQNLWTLRAVFCTFFSQT